MTTHQLAELLDTLKRGLGSSLKSDASSAFEEAAAAFREMPDVHLKKVAEQLRKPATSVNGKTSGTTAINVSAAIDQIRAVRSGTVAEPPADLDKLNNAHLREVLTALGEKPTTKTAANLAKVKQLLHSTGERNGTPSVTAPEPGLVEEGVRLYTYLRDTKGLTIPEVRARFATIRNYPQPVVEAITHKVGYTPEGSLREILDRLQTNLETIKMHQLSAEFVGSGA